MFDRVWEGPKDSTGADGELLLHSRSRPLFKPRPSGSINHAIGADATMMPLRSPPGEVLPKKAEVGTGTLLRARLGQTLIKIETTFVSMIIRLWGLDY